jgi:hypothetical protein
VGSPFTTQSFKNLSPATALRKDGAPVALRERRLEGDKPGAAAGLSLGSVPQIPTLWAKSPHPGVYGHDRGPRRGVSQIDKAEFRRRPTTQPGNPNRTLTNGLRPPVLQRA